MTASPIPPAEEVHAEAERPDLPASPPCAPSPVVSRPPPSHSSHVLKHRNTRILRPIRLGLMVALCTVLFYLSLCVIFESSPKPIKPSVSASDFKRLEAKVDALSSSVALLSQQIKDLRIHLQTLIQSDKHQAHNSFNQAEKMQWDFLSNVVTGLSSIFEPKQNEKQKEQKTTTTSSTTSAPPHQNTPPQENKRLRSFHAATTGEEVYTLIARRANIEEFNDENDTPLITAIKRGKFDVVFSLVAQGADPNNSHPGSKKPIHWAALGGQAKMIEELVKRGANVNDISREGTPLMIACTQRHTQAVETLLRLKANTEIKDKQEWTPLMRASNEGNIDVVDRLLTFKAKVNAQSPYQHSPLFLAAENSHLEIMNMLAAHGADVDHRDSFGWTLLMRAVSNGKTNVVDRLIGLGCDVNLQKKDDKTALMIAAEDNKTEIVRILLANGADTRIAGKKGRTAIELTRSQEIKDLIRQYESNKPKKDRK